MKNTSSFKSKLPMHITIDGYKIRVLDGAYTDGDTPTPAATEFGKQLITMLPAMKRFASQELLETYKDSWAEDEDDELEAAQFEANLVSPEIVIYDEIGAASVYFQDSDMFAGHLIDVSFNEGLVTHATLAG